MKRLLVRKVTEVEQKLIDTILTTQTLHSYKQQNQFWYVVKFNEGTYVHYCFHWTRQDTTIEYKLSPHLKLK